MWYIRKAVYVVPWYHTTYDTYHQLLILYVCDRRIPMCATDVYLAGGTINRAYVS